MSRFSQYDTDEERLPEGMTRVGYDADTEVYTFQDSDGSYWESAPGNRYGHLTRVSGGPAQESDDDAADVERLLPTEQASYRQGVSWRTDLMPLLNFGLIIGVSLLLFIWYLHKATASASSSESSPLLQCGPGSAPYTVAKGDSCWGIADARGCEVDDILLKNPGLDCDVLRAGSEICVPEAAKQR